MGSKITMIKYFLFLCIQLSSCALLMTRRDDLECAEISKDILEKVLGTAYNPEYMRIDPPPEMKTQPNGSDKVSFETNVNVKNTDYQEETDTSWMTDFETMGNGKRSKRFRRHTQLRYDWQCDSVVIWKDLGPDYFPRFLRTVECTQSRCFDDLYTCQPKSFAVKMLRRKNNECVLAERGMIIGYSGLPRDLREMWVWEERAMNFCCNCVPN